MRLPVSPSPCLLALERAVATVCYADLELCDHRALPRAHFRRFRKTRARDRVCRLPSGRACRALHFQWQCPARQALAAFSRSEETNPCDALVPRSRHRLECSLVSGQILPANRRRAFTPVVRGVRDGRKRPSTEWQKKFAPKANYTPSAGLLQSPLTNRRRAFTPVGFSARRA